MAKKITIEKQPQSARDELMASLADEINKKSKEGKIAYFLDEQDDPSTISGWISTGSTFLDLAISNRPNGGLPIGRMVELNGLEGTGKSLISAHLVANTQKAGGKAIVIDTENAAAPDFWKSLGVELNNLMYVQRETVEGIFEMIEQCITYIRKNDENVLVTIIVDSVAAASTKAELESEHGKTGYATDKSIIISKAMRKITSMIGRQKVLIVFTNQLRQNLKAVAFGDQWTVSGGKALAYHCSVRVRLANTGKLKKGDVVIGNGCKASVVKNRMGPPNRQALFDIYYDSGIADYASWLKVLETAQLLTESKGSKVFKRLDGTEITFKGRELPSLLTSTPDLKAEMYDKICEAVIMKYKEANSIVEEEVSVETEDNTTDGPPSDD